MRWLEVCAVDDIDLDQLPMRRNEASDTGPVLCQCTNRTDVLKIGKEAFVDVARYVTVDTRQVCLWIQVAHPRMSRVSRRGGSEVERRRALADATLAVEYRESSHDAVTIPRPADRVARDSSDPGDRWRA